MEYKFRKIAKMGTRNIVHNQVDRMTPERVARNSRFFDSLLFAKLYTISQFLSTVVSIYVSFFMS